MVAVQTLGPQPVLDAGEPVRVPIVLVSRDFLSTLGVAPFVGRDMTHEENALGGAARGAREPRLLGQRA